MNRFATGLLALAGIAVAASAPAAAGDGTQQYSAGLVEAAIAKGDTVLLHYKSTW